MFIEEAVQVAVPVAVAGQRLQVVLDFDGLSAVSNAAMTAERRVLVRAGFAGVTKQVSVQVATAYLRGQTVVIPLRWSATGPTGALYPTLDANLELDPTPESQTRLTLRGSYRLPGGAVGARIDHAALQLVARATLRAFVAELEYLILAPARLSLDPVQPAVGWEGLAEA